MFLALGCSVATNLLIPRRLFPDGTRRWGISGALSDGFIIGRVRHWDAWFEPNARNLWLIQASKVPVPKTMVHIAMKKTTKVKNMCNRVIIVFPPFVLVKES